MVAITEVSSTEVPRHEAEATGMEAGTIITMAGGTGMVGMVGGFQHQFGQMESWFRRSHRATQALLLPAIHIFMVMACISDKCQRVVLP